MSTTAVQRRGPPAPRRDPLVTPPLPRGADLYSCDVFDTAITRLVGAPSAVFLILARRLSARGLLHLSPHSFASARHAADRRASANNGRGWSLACIYRELQFTLGLTDELRDAIMAEELALERELLRPVPGMRERLAAARAAGMKVAFLSDMYVDSGFLRSVLESFGLCGAGDACYVSSETAVGKEDGRAFRRLAEIEKVPLRRIVHRGNHLEHDVIAAHRVGAQVEPCPACNPNRYEQSLEHWATGTDSLASVMAGASRMARLTVPARTQHEAALRDAAAGVGAPMLVSFVLWILDQARREGVRRLYFLGRDGWIMHEIAERLVVRLGIDIENRYLHGGRRTWYMASVMETGQPDIFWAIDHASEGDSVDSFLRRIELDPDDVAAALEALGHARATWTTPIPRDRHDVLWAIPRDPVIRERLLEHAAAKRQRALAYFRQEGLFDSNDWAVVDVGWSGRVVGAMDRMLRTAGARVPLVFFFSRFIDHVDHAMKPTMPIRAYYSDHTRNTGYHHVAYELFFEVFLGALEGAALDYEERAGRILPRLAAPDNPALEAWGLPIVHETILEFTDQLWLDEAAVNIHANMRSCVSHLFHLFVHSPTKAEAVAWGSYPFEYGRSGVITATLGAAYRLSQLPQALRYGYVAHRMHTEWYQAGIRATPEPTRFILRSAMALRRRVAPRLKRLLHRLGLRQ